MKLVVLLLLIGFAAGFFVVGYLLRANKKGGYATLTGFVLLLLGGILAMVFGIDYQSGLLATDSGATTTVAYEYTSLTSLENLAAALPLILAGIWGIWVCAISLREIDVDDVGNEAQND